MNKAIRFFCMAAAVTILCGCGHDAYPNTKAIIDEIYSLQGSDNIRFVFSKDSTLVVRQTGIYDPVSYTHLCLSPAGLLLTA